MRSPTPIRLLEECVHVLCLVLDNTKQQGRKRLNLNTPFPIWDLCMDCTVIARASGEHCRVRDVQKAHPNCGRPSCNSHLHPYKEWSQASFCLFPRVSLWVCGSTPGCDKHVTSMAIGPATRTQEGTRNPSRESRGSVVRKLLSGKETAIPSQQHLEGGVKRGSARNPCARTSEDGQGPKEIQSRQSLLCTTNLEPFHCIRNPVPSQTLIPFPDSPSAMHPASMLGLFLTAEISMQHSGKTLQLIVTISHRSSS